jgi:hypothetical protein
MSRRRSHRPPARPRPLRDAEGALTVVSAACAEPPRPETICLLVDAARMPLSCLVVEGGDGPDDVLAIGELLAELSHGLPLAHVVLASCRPGLGLVADDIARWHALDALLTEDGVELVDWFVSDGMLVASVAAHAGVVSRWPGQP